MGDNMSYTVQQADDIFEIGFTQATGWFQACHQPTTAVISLYYRL